MTSDEPPIGDAAEAFAHGHESGVGLAQRLEEFIERDLAAALQEVLAKGGDPVPVIRSIVSLLRDVADALESGIHQ
jgi:hypothetical protein